MRLPGRKRRSLTTTTERNQIKWQSQTPICSPKSMLGQLIGELYLPFPADVIKVRPAGTGNKPLSYVSHPHYTRRLDRIFPMAWSFSTEVVAIQDNACGVKGSLSITLEDGRVITRESYGHSAINKRKPLGDALKFACSDALKKICKSVWCRSVSLHRRRRGQSPDQQRPAHQRPL